MVYLTILKYYYIRFRPNESFKPPPVYYQELLFKNIVFDSD